MLQGRERQSGLCRRFGISPATQRVEHAGRERIAGTDPVDDAGQRYFGRLYRTVTHSR